MKQLASLAWKEWHEVRWFLWIAVGLFVGMPVLGALEGMYISRYRQEHFYFDAGPWIVQFGLGGVFAVMVAVALVCLDLGGRREDFLRSRPISLARWVAMKYFIGLLVVLAVCTVPLVIELSVNFFSRNHTEVAVVWYPFLWTALYSLSFACACLVRRMAHATMLGFAAMLLLYFLPVVLPFLKYISIDWVMDRSLTLARVYPSTHLMLPGGARVSARQLLFVAGMLAISGMAWAASVVAVARDWRVESGTKTMYWSAGSVLLILFASASFRLATNVPILQQIDLPQGQFVRDIQFSGTWGVLITFSPKNGAEWQYFSRTLRISDAGLEIGSPMKLPGASHTTWVAEHPQTLFFPRFQSDSPQLGHLELRTFSLDGSSRGQTIRLWDEDPKKRGGTRLYGVGDRLYVLGDKFATVDISDPAQPRLLSAERARYGNVEGYGGRGANGRLVGLPLISGLSPRQRLDARMNEYGRRVDGDVLVDTGGDSLQMYVLDHLDDTTAHFTGLAGRYEPSLLEHVFGSSANIAVVGGRFAYLEEWSFAGFMSGSPRFSIFDIRDPRQPRLVGHFAVAGQHSGVIAPLPDGRAIIGGDRVFLVGKPPMKD